MVAFLFRLSQSVLLSGGLILFVLLYLLLVHPKNRFRSANIPHLIPWPVFGNILPILFGKVTWHQFASDTYNRFKVAGLGGIFYWNRSVLVLTNPDLITKIACSDAEHFMNHPDTFQVDSILEKNLSVLTGQRWKEMRAALAPVFTSNRLDKIVYLLTKPGQQMYEYLKVKYEQKGEGLLEVNLQELFDRYSIDAIATTVFNNDIDSYKNPLNDFYQNSQQLRNLSSFSQTIKRFIGSILGVTFSKFLGIKILDQHAVKYFESLLKENINEYRLKNTNECRIDFLQYFIDAADQENSPLTNDELIAQSVLFMFHGHSSVTQTLTLVAQQLAQHRDIQKKMFAEMETVWPKDQKLTQEIVQQMKYFNAVFYECIRYQSPTSFLDRKCQFRFHFSSGRQAYTPLPGDIVWIPVHGIHHDKKYYAKPNEMMPERFLDINPEETHPNTFLPFGQGDRKCLGYRYAISNCMIALAYLIRHFELSPPLGVKDPLNYCVLKQERNSQIGISLRR